MCNAASFVLTKNKIFWSKFCESHETIIDENKLCPDGLAGANVVRVEITPPGGDWALPVEEWIYKTDQGEDCLPDWYDLEDCARRSRLALQDWAKSKIILSGSRDFVRDHVVCIAGTARVERIEECAHVDSIGGQAAVSYLTGDARVDCLAGGASVQRLEGRASIDSMEDRAKIGVMAGISMLCRMHGNAYIGQVARCAQIERVFGDARIGTLHGESRVLTLSGRAQIGQVSDSSSVMEVTEKAHISEGEEWLRLLPHPVRHEPPRHGRERNVVFQ